MERIVPGALPRSPEVGRGIARVSAAQCGILRTFAIASPHGVLHSNRVLPFVVAFGLLVHVCFWGAGLAVLAMPRPWRRFWPLVAAPLGCTLQMLVVWAGAYAGLRGTNAYAWPAELIPAVLLAAAVVRRGSLLGADVARVAGVWTIAGAALAALVLPLARAAKGLTTVSLGNCDAADYAAGARVLQAFAHGDRRGFLGLAEVVGTQGVNNFFDFWLRLNHFTPSALIAFNGTIFHCAPHELTSLIPMVVAASSGPVVFWLARSIFRFPRTAALALSAIYGFSPITWYAVDQVAIAQLLAAPAIGLVTWSGVALWRGARVRRIFPLLVLAYALLWGSYNFIVVVSAAAAAGYALGSAFCRRRWARLVRWAAWMIIPALVSGFALWPRLAGVAARFRLLDVYNEGWAIPGFSPAGWIGLLQAPELRGLGAAAGAAAAVLMLAAFARGLRGRRKAAAAILFTAAPPLIGYAYLVWRGARYGTNASYDAYKLFSVFYPTLLAAAFVWIHPACVPRRLRPVAYLLFAAAAALNLRADCAFAQAVAHAPYVVDRPLLAVAAAESDPRIGSLNLRVPNMWDRLWANELLLGKPQYFLTDTYEARWHTPLRGAWDLVGGDLTLSLPAGDSVALGPRFCAVRVASPDYLRAELGSGWHSRERLPRSSVTWRWTGNDAQLEIDNPQPRPLDVRLRLDADSLVSRRLSVVVDGRPAAQAQLAPERREVVTTPFAVASGAHRIELIPFPAAVPATGGDTRTLAFCVFGLDIQVLPDGT